jgi:hypothetical protein
MIEEERYRLVDLCILDDVVILEYEDDTSRERSEIVDEKSEGVL